MQQTLLFIAQPLFYHPPVQSKMSKFDSRMGSLQVSTCGTCMERFPGMTVRITSAKTECIHCNKDQQSPDNNMNPGLVPQELMVSASSYQYYYYHNLESLTLCVDLDMYTYLIVCSGLHTWRRCLSQQ